MLKDEKVMPAPRIKVNNSLSEKLFGHNFLLFVTIILFIAMYVVGLFAFADKNFNTLQAFLNLLISNSGLIIASVGMTMVLITGGIDISVGGVVTVTCVAMASMMEKAHMDAFSTMGIMIAFGIVFGLMQGFLVAYLKIQPFIVTLAGMFLTKGLAAVISLEMITVTNQTFLNMAQFKIYLPFGGATNANGVTLMPFVYPTVILALVILAVAYIILKYTKFGRRIYAVGGNEQSALLMGLNVKRTKLAVYMLSGLLATIGGIAFCMNTVGAFLEIGKNFEMDSIAATVIGGTSLMGGVGNVIGTLFGVLIKAAIEAFVSFQGNISSWWAKIIISAILAFFIVLQSLLASRKSKRR